MGTNERMMSRLWYRPLNRMKNILGGIKENREERTDNHQYFKEWSCLAEKVYFITKWKKEARYR